MELRQEIRQRLRSARSWPSLIEELEKEADQIQAKDQKARRLYELGELCEDLFLRKDRAMIHYQAAFKLSPQDARALERAREIYREMGNLEMVAKLLELEWKVTADAARLALTEVALSIHGTPVQVTASWPWKGPGHVVGRLGPGTMAAWPGLPPALAVDGTVSGRFEATGRSLDDGTARAGLRLGDVRAGGVPLPTPVKVDSREPGAAEGKTEHTGSWEQTARATAKPFAESYTKLSPVDIGGIITFEGGSTRTTSGLDKDDKPQATAEVNIAGISILGGLVKLDGLRWRSASRPDQKDPTTMFMEMI